VRPDAACSRTRAPARVNGLGAASASLAGGGRESSGALRAGRERVTPQGRSMILRISGSAIAVRAVAGSGDSVGKERPAGLPNRQRSAIVIWCSGSDSPTRGRPAEGGGEVETDSRQITPKHHGEPAIIRGQRTRPVNKIHNPAKSAKPPSPVQIRAALQFSCLNFIVCSSRAQSRASELSRIRCTFRGKPGASR
jgi:hypothetical protein